MRVGLMLAVLCAAATGCGGGPEIASVSGVVKVNNKPYKNAVVSFQPVGTRDSPNPGRGSAAVTDENGQFSLVYDGVKPGAIVGKHQVRIFTKFGVEAPADFKSDSAPGVAAEKYFEPIPPEWNENSTKTFEVPSGGTKEANFDISTKPGSKG
ncbi:MAG: DUF4198 domain-containing protein [Gemmataceae bacterium]|nr:DUF4198 domain-containing protein [Gemmataceae bacterium]